MRSHSLALLPGGNDGVHDSAAEACFLQGANTLNGGTAGGADLVLQLPWVLSGLQHQFRRADHHLGGALHGQRPGQAAGYAAVRQRLQKQVREGRTTACHGAASIHQAVRQRG